MERKRILLLGSGGREHAIATKLHGSPHCEALFITPGNAGTSACGTNVPIAVTDFDGIRKLVLDQNINLVVVGPEEPLVRGIVDFFLNDEQLRNIPVVGPDQKAAMLEGSKDMAKAFMAKYRIPTARYKTFTRQTIADGEEFLAQLHAPYVLKADGLAAGKGVIITESITEAKATLREMLEAEKFGEAGSRVVIEEFLSGIELSVFVLTDGKSYLILPEAKDYKRIGDGDTGPNTGGMGAVSPVPFATPEFMRKVEDRIVKPTIDGINGEGMNYRGFIFIGLMNCNGEPYVIEYNVRMGDPETEVVFPRIKNDCVELFDAVANGTLGRISLETDERTALTIMLVSEGYPGTYIKGRQISLPASGRDTHIFHAGTSTKDGHIVTSGGRVLAITSIANSIEEARKKSYDAAGNISFEGMNFRKDIGLDLIRVKV